MSEALKHQRQEQGVIIPAAKTNVVAINAGMNYLAKHSSTGIPVRFNKEGKFILPTEGDKELPEGTELAVIWDQARGGFQRFGAKGEKPEYRLGLIFGSKPPPERDELPDNDPTQWPVSDLTGEKEDPWREVQMVPLQSIAAKSTSSPVCPSPAFGRCRTYSPNPRAWRRRTAIPIRTLSCGAADMNTSASVG